jgi:hypothetical protein
MTYKEKKVILDHSFGGSSPRLGTPITWVLCCGSRWQWQGACDRENCSHQEPGDKRERLDVTQGQDLSDLSTLPKSPPPKGSYTSQECHPRDKTFNLWASGGPVPSAQVINGD